MKVLHIITSLNAGGAQRSLFSLISGGLQKSHESAVLSLTSEGIYGSQLRSMGIEVHVLGMLPGRPTLRALLKLRAVVKKYRPEIIQGWMYHGNIAAYMASMLSPGHILILWNVRHSLYAIEKEKPLTRFVIRVNRVLSNAADAIIYNSNISRKQHEDFGFSSKHSLVIQNGFDLERWRPNQEFRSSLRKRLGVPDDAFLIGHIARLHPMKDHPFFLNAAATLAETNKYIHYLLVGTGVTSDNLQFQQYSSRLPAERVHFLGESSDVEKIMPSLDVFCLTSAWGEAFPNVLGEAMACGVPCVATDVGDSREILGDTGKIVPVNHKQRLVAAVTAILSQTQNERSCLGQAARERIRIRFSLASVVERYVRLYTSYVND